MACPAKSPPHPTHATKRSVEYITNACVACNAKHDTPVTSMRPACFTVEFVVALITADVHPLPTARRRSGKSSTSTSHSNN